MGSPRRLLVAIATAAVVALGLAALMQAHRRPDQALGGANTAAFLLQFAAGLGAWLAGIDLALRWSMRASGALLAVTGPAVFLGAVPLPEAGGALLFTAALAGGACAPALAGAAALRHPAIARRHLDALVAGGTVAGAVIVLGLLPTATFDPQASGCFTCPRNLLLVHGDAALHDAVLRNGLRAEALLCAVAAVLAFARWAGHPALLRWTAAPVVVGGATAAALGAASFAHAGDVGAPLVDATTRALWLAQCAVLALAAAGVAVQRLRARALRRRIADIVVETLPSPDRLRAALAIALGDPRLAIAYPGLRDGPVDADGRPAGVPAPGTVVTEVTRGREVVAMLLHDAALMHAPERLAAAARGAGPALEHASLRARLRAELAELSASRTRIVEVADAARQRVERDLHDGAQQRLIALSIALQQIPRHNGSLGRAGDELQVALDDLRALAHGIHPASLTEAGITAAIREVAERSRVPVRLATLPGERCPAPVEAAAHRLVLDAVRCAERNGDGGTIVITIEYEDTCLRATLTLPGVRHVTASLNLEHARDRIAALEGQMTIRDEPAGSRVEACLPCGS
jgi:signal transduction histidine kinase